MRKKNRARKKAFGLSGEGELGDEVTIKVIIHYGGTMKKEDGEFEYVGELGTKTVFWKFEEFRWANFEEFGSSVGIDRPVKLIHFKGTSADISSVDYVYDIVQD